MGPADPHPTRFVVVGASFLDVLHSGVIEPRFGKTVPTRETRLMPGGKGLNQAVGVSRYGRAVEVQFVTALSDDAYGMAIRHQLESGSIFAQIDEDAAAPILVLGPPLRATPGVTILVGAGQHGMIAPPGASKRDYGQNWVEGRHLSFADACAKAIRSADAILATLDYPEVIRDVIRYADRSRKPFLMLNPAPAPRPSAVSRPDIMAFDWLVPNVAEARVLLGRTSRAGAQSKRAQASDRGTAAELAAALRTEYGTSVCVTASDAGCAWVLSSDPEVHPEPAMGVNPADVTGASDAFCATLAVELAQLSRSERDATRVEAAIQQALAAGALAVETLGSSAAMPGPNAIGRFVDSERPTGTRAIYTDTDADQ
jgi:ribokinase